MATGAVRVMAAGKAGLESLPMFVDELMAQGIPQLAPWAIDHSQDQIDYLGDMTRNRVIGSWKGLFEIGVSPPGITMDTDTTPNRRLLTLINPWAAEMTEVADSPAQLGAWCRRQLGAICRETEMMWERYKAENGITGSYHLAVVIPFCPEGPTSGTVGMYLGAALRQHFAVRGKADELIVWGIELCPPLDSSDSGDLDRLAVQNAFRGYTARQELVEGVPLSDEAGDKDLRQPFDINIVFDGGRADLATASRDEVWQAIDRAAAQVTACLLNGAGGGDKPEATVQLKQGQRWNAYLAHVVSERSYGSASRYLTYRVALPWHRDQKAWNSAKTIARRDAFLRRIDSDIIPRIRHEPNGEVKKRVEDLIQRADEMRGISLEPKLTDLFRRKHKQAMEQVESLLTEAFRYDEFHYSETCSNETIPERPIAREDLFCINVVMPENQRLEAAQTERDNGVPVPISQVLGAAGIANVRSRLADFCTEVLKRHDCDPVRDNSEAFFDELMSISVEDQSRGGSNDDFCPTRENLSFFVAADRRGIPGSFGEMSFDLSEVVATPIPDGVDVFPAQQKTLNWRLRAGLHDIPVEYSILTLGRVRSGDGFKDISTYGELEDNYKDLTSDQDRWIELARYYGVKPPDQWWSSDADAAADGSADAAPPATLSANGQKDQVDLLQDNA